MRHCPRYRSPLRYGLVTACLMAVSLSTSARAQTTPAQPAAAQPTLPPSGGSKPTSPVVESLVADSGRVLDVRKAARAPGHHREAHSRHRHFARHYVAPAIERPALAGVELLQALPHPGEPPHIAVPLPAYPLDSLVAAATMPAPPVVCHPVRRDPTLPDPRLYRERTVTCEADNP